MSFHSDGDTSWLPAPVIQVNSTTAESFQIRERECCSWRDRGSFGVPIVWDQGMTVWKPGSIEVWKGKAGTEAGKVNLEHGCREWYLHSPAVNWDMENITPQKGFWRSLSWTPGWSQRRWCLCRLHGVWCVACSEQSLPYQPAPQHHPAHVLFSCSEQRSGWPAPPAAKTEWKVGCEPGLFWLNVFCLLPILHCHLRV